MSTGGWITRDFSSVEPLDPDANRLRDRDVGVGAARCLAIDLAQSAAEDAQRNARGRVFSARVDVREPRVAKRRVAVANVDGVQRPRVHGKRMRGGDHQVVLVEAQPREVPGHQRKQVAPTSAPVLSLADPRQAGETRLRERCRPRARTDQGPAQPEGEHVRLVRHREESGAHRLNRPLSSVIPLEPVVDNHRAPGDQHWECRRDRHLCSRSFTSAPDGVADFHHTLADGALGGGLRGPHQRGRRRFRFRGTCLAPATDGDPGPDDVRGPAGHARLRADQGRRRLRSSSRASLESGCAGRTSGDAETPRIRPTTGARRRPGRGRRRCRARSHRVHHARAGVGARLRQRGDRNELAEAGRPRRLRHCRSAPLRERARGTWQVWNEPNARSHLNPQYRDGRPVTPRHYRSMVNAFAKAVHTVNPDYVVVAGALAPFGHFARISRSSRPSISCARCSASREEAHQRARHARSSTSGLRTRIRTADLSDRRRHGTTCRSATSLRSGVYSRRRARVTSLHEPRSSSGLPSSPGTRDHPTLTASPRVFTHAGSRRRSTRCGGAASRW